MSMLGAYPPMERFRDRKHRERLESQVDELTVLCERMAVTCVAAEDLWAGYKLDQLVDSKGLPSRNLSIEREAA